MKNITKQSKQQGKKGTESRQNRNKNLKWTDGSAKLGRIQSTDIKRTNQGKKTENNITKQNKK